MSSWSSRIRRNVVLEQQDRPNWRPREAGQGRMSSRSNRTGRNVVQEQQDRSKCRPGAAGQGQEGSKCRPGAAGQSQEGSKCRPGAAGQGQEGSKCRPGAARQVEMSSGGSRTGRKPDRSPTGIPKPDCKFILIYIYIHTYLVGTKHAGDIFSLFLALRL